MACKGICNRYKAPGPRGGGRYANGQKRCRICERFIVWSGVWCPCCNTKLASGSRNKRLKRARTDTFRVDT